MTPSSDPRFINLICIFRQSLIEIYFGFTEAMLYRVAQFYEDASGWTKHHPAALAD